MTDPPSRFGPAEFLREARRRVPELEDALEPWSGAPESRLADAVGYETFAFVSDSEEVDRDTVACIFNFWPDVLGCRGVDAEVRNMLVGVIGLLRGNEQWYVRASAERALLQLRQVDEPSETDEPSA